MGRHGILVIALWACACKSAREPASPTPEAAIEECIRACHEDQQQNPEETPYDCRAACEEGEMRSVSTG